MMFCCRSCQWHSFWVSAWRSYKLSLPFTFVDPGTRADMLIGFQTLPDNMDFLCNNCLGFSHKTEHFLIVFCSPGSSGFQTTVQYYGWFSGVLDFITRMLLNNNGDTCVLVSIGFEQFELFRRNRYPWPRPLRILPVHLLGQGSITFYWNNFSCPQVTATPYRSHLWDYIRRLHTRGYCGRAVWCIQLVFWMGVQILAVTMVLVFFSKTLYHSFFSQPVV